MFEYKVVPFMGQIKNDKFTWENAKQVASQLEDLIKKECHDGWEFYRTDRVAIQVKPSCLAALFGAKVFALDFDQLIFRKTKS